MGLVIRFQGGQRAGQVMKFGDDVDRVVIGRDPEKCQILFPAEETKVGREHCALVRQLGRYRLVINKENAVFVEGREAIDDQELPAAVQLQLGRGGPKLVLENERRQDIPSTEMNAVGPGRATMLREARSSSRRALQLGIVAALAIVLLGVGGLWLRQQTREDKQEQTNVDVRQNKEIAAVQGRVTQHTWALTELRQRTDAQEMQLAGLGSKFGTVEGKLKKQQQLLTKLAPGLKDALEKATASVYLVLAKEVGGNERAIATCWVFDQQKGILATNAHVAEEFERLRDDGFVREGKSVQFVVRSSETTPRDHVVKEVRIHADYRLFEELWAQYDPVRRLTAASIEQIGSAGPACDVALMTVEDAAGLGPALPLADDKTLRELRAGTRVGYVGFPMEGLALGGGPLVQPAPQMHMAYVTNVTDFFGFAGAPHEQRSLVQHALPAAGGASGSPILDQKGHVIAVLSGVNFVGSTADGSRVGSSANINFAQRVDTLKELASDADKTSTRQDIWKKQIARYFQRRVEQEQQIATPGAIAGALEQWRESLSGTGEVEELPSASGKTDTASDDPQVYQHRITMEIDRTGEYLLMAVGHAGAAIRLDVFAVQGSDRNLLSNDTGSYPWLGVAPFQASAGSTLEVLVSSHSADTEYVLNRYVATVQKTTRDGQLATWKQYLKDTHLVETEPDLVIDGAELELEAVSGESAYVRQIELLSGHYFIVAEAENDEDIDLVVSDESDGSRVEDVRVDPLACVFLSRSEQGPVTLAVEGPAVGVKFRLYIYRVAAEESSP